MGIQVWVIGPSQAVPANYKSLVINDALIDWIESLTRDYGIEATDFSADRADGVGLVNARVTLQDAP